MHRVDGSVIHAELAATPFRYRGQPGAQVMVLDLTQRDTAEEEIRRLNAALAQRVQTLD